MLRQESAKEPCIENFPRVIQGVDACIRVGPKVKKVPPPRNEQHGNLDLSHHADEVGLYTEQEERDFEHVTSLLHCKEQVTHSLRTMNGISIHCQGPPHTHCQSWRKRP